MPTNTPPLTPPLHAGEGDRGGVRILFLGDIVGKPGRRAVQALLPNLRKELDVDVVIANVENLAHGKGITRSTWEEIRLAGVDIGTGGNHLFSKPEANDLLADPDMPIVRPMNIRGVLPGQGEKTFTIGQKKVTVVNLLGQFGMSFEGVENPFPMIDQWATGRSPAATVIVDFHAEATSERVAMGWMLDGRVGAVIGTHTHVPTADARVLPGGTAYITDVGMVGLRDSSLGVDKEAAISFFLRGQGGLFTIAEHGRTMLNAVLMTFDGGRATAITPIVREVDV